MTTHHSRKQENGLQGCKDRLGLNPRLSDYRWLIDQVERLTKNLAGLQELADEHAWTENNPSRYAKVVEDRDIWIANAKAWDKKRMAAEKERDGFRDANDFLGNGFKRVVKERDEAIAQVKMMLKAFGHIHEGPDDKCRQCGLGIREKIHSAVVAESKEKNQ